MEALLDRFCRYVRVNTQADEKATTYPSSPGQLELGRLLVKELREMGLGDAEADEHGIVMATIPARRRGRGGDGPRKPSPGSRIWILPRKLPGTMSSQSCIAATTARTFVLSGDPSKVLRVSECPELAKLRGSAIINDRRHHAPGGDDKCGVAVIMETAAHLLAHPEIPHGPIRICFTCDEEIGHGVDHVDLKKLGAQVAYTLDGAGTGEIDGETFSADSGRRDHHRHQHPSVHRQRQDGERDSASRRVSGPAATTHVVAGKHG